MRDRISGHRGRMNKPKEKREKLSHKEEDEAALADHLRSCHDSPATSDDFDSNYTFTVLQICEQSSLAHREYKWIADVKILLPFGLNIAKPFGISESLIGWFKMRRNDLFHV